MQINILVEISLKAYLVLIKLVEPTYYLKIGKEANNKADKQF
jgi:hypothetical protein